MPDRGDVPLIQSPLTDCPRCDGLGVVNRGDSYERCYLCGGSGVAYPPGRPKIRSDPDTVNRLLDELDVHGYLARWPVTSGQKEGPVPRRSGGGWTGHHTQGT